jgi:hypothetical protein
MDVRWHDSGNYGPTMEIMKDDAGGAPWNPLADDGDALRLAVELGFNVYHAASSVFVEDLDSNVEIQHGHENDKFAATRRAIVRAAAEIGWEMS